MSGNGGGSSCPQMAKGKVKTSPIKSVKTKNLRVIISLSFLREGFC